VDDASFSSETLDGTGGARRLPAIGTHTGSLLAVLSIFTSVFRESTECSNVRERVFESLLVHDGFSHDGASGIAGAQKQNVVAVWHREFVDAAIPRED
jgi:hypothetical protein